MPAKKTPQPKEATPVQQQADPVEMTYCPRCNRVDADFGSCNGPSFNIGCPTPVPVEDGKVALLSCGPCGWTRAFPVGEIVKGKTKGNSTPRCPRDTCLARLL